MASEVLSAEERAAMCKVAGHLVTYIISGSAVLRYEATVVQAEERIAELERELAAEKAKSDCPCGACGEPMEGEWFEGDELTCVHCGVEVYAHPTRAGGWAFPTVHDVEEDRAMELEDDEARHAG